MKTYNSVELYSATINKVIQKKKVECGIFVKTYNKLGRTRNIIVTKDLNGIYDIRNSNINLEQEMIKDHKIIIARLEPLYTNGVHKVVSTRRAYFDLAVSRIKKVVNR